MLHSLQGTWFAKEKGDQQYQGFKEKLQIVNSRIAWSLSGDNYSQADSGDGGGEGKEDFAAP